ncbi:hypothetical protein CRUP_012655 [Coryphaenoides rupestris]|nr:hypothetical protein CRUP_012655 [Coryphaenoides rupestris]
MMKMMMVTALLYDEEMTKYKLLWVDPACEVEAPERLLVSYEALERSGLGGRCVSIPPGREASDPEILLAHRISTTVPSWPSAPLCSWWTA